MITTHRDWSSDAIYAFVNNKIIASDNGLSPVWRPTIIWTNASLLFNKPLWINISETWIPIQWLLFRKMNLNMSSVKWWSFYLGSDVLFCRDTNRFYLYLSVFIGMGLLRVTQNFGLHMRRKWRERFPRHKLQRIPLVSYPGMHHGMWMTHVPWCMSGSLTHGGAENIPGMHSRCMRIR